MADAPANSPEEAIPKRIGNFRIVRVLGAGGLKDMGRTMAALKQRYAGQMDFAKASSTVKELLS